MLRSDPPAWTDETFSAYAPLPSFTLPQATGGTHWVWTSNWMVDMSMRGYGAPGAGSSAGEHVVGAVDAEGWSYALNRDSPYGYDYAVDGAPVQLQSRAVSRVLMRKTLDMTLTPTPIPILSLILPSQPRP